MKWCDQCTGSASLEHHPGHLWMRKWKVMSTTDTDESQNVSQTVPTGMNWIITDDYTDYNCPTFKCRTQDHISSVVDTNCRTITDRSEHCAVPPSNNSGQWADGQTWGMSHVMWREMVRDWWPWLVEPSSGDSNLLGPSMSACTYSRGHLNKSAVCIHEEHFMSSAT